MRRILVSRKLTVVPEKCSGCKLCEVVCSINRF
ncbi:MAG: 4Fe-4S binding protein, partial [Deltaproteobacteria bacterium]|nr:4Fe-4S binding protein [Deltaproteobacteria bacterium]